MKAAMYGICFRSFRLLTLGFNSLVFFLASVSFGLFSLLFFLVSSILGSGAYAKRGHMHHLYSRKKRPKKRENTHTHSSFYNALGPSLFSWNYGYLLSLPFLVMLFWHHGTSPHRHIPQAFPIPPPAANRLVFVFVHMTTLYEG